MKSTCKVNEQRENSWQKDWESWRPVQSLMMASGDLAGATLGRVMSDIDSHGGALLPYSSSTVTVTHLPTGPVPAQTDPTSPTSRGVFPASKSQSRLQSAPPVGNNESEGLDALYVIITCPRALSSCTCAVNIKEYGGHLFKLVFHYHTSITLWWSSSRQWLF